MKRNVSIAIQSNTPKIDDQSAASIRVEMMINIFIISFTLILAADWSIAVGYWTVFHCFSLLVNFRMEIRVLSSLLTSRLNVLFSFAMVTMVDLKFTGHSLVGFYITRHTKRIKNKIKNLKLKKN